MKASTRVLLGVLVVAAIGIAVALMMLEEPEAPAMAFEPRDERANIPREENLAVEPVPDDRVAATSSSPGAGEKPSTTPAGAEVSRPVFRVRGRVLDMRGAPVPGVTIVASFTQPDSECTSDAFGMFEVDLERGGRLVSKSEEWITVRCDVVARSDPDRERLVIVAPPMELSGRVVDEANRPIPGATLAVRIPIAAFAGFPLALDSTGVVAPPSISTGQDGTFELRRLPVIGHANLATRSAGFATDVRPMPSESTSDLLIELRESEPSGAVLTGVVVHHDGKPAKGAVVHIDDQEARTDKNGSFRLELGPVEAEAPLVATMEGVQAAVIPAYGEVIRANDGHPPPVRLVLGREALSILGRVVEADGKPCPSWTVSIREGTAVSQFQIPVITAENLTAGGHLDDRTDKEGKFQLRGLREGSYVLRAWSRDGRMIHSDPIPAGTKWVELRCPPDEIVERITGRVVARDGTPLSDVAVEVQLVTLQTSFGSSWNTVRQTRTKPDGTFEIPRVSRRFTRLSVSGDGVETTERMLDEMDLGQPIEVVVLRACRFRFEGDPGDEAPTHLSVLDAGGKTLDLVTKQAGGMSSGSRAALTEGKSHVLTVSEDAERLVLYRGEEILSSQPLRLVPDEIVTVRRER